VEKSVKGMVPGDTEGAATHVVGACGDNLEEGMAGVFLLKPIEADAVPCQVCKRFLQAPPREASLSFRPAQ